MFNFSYDNLPQDEYEAKALRELMGLNIELPKARLLKILREHGGDSDAASAAAFVEMREQYRKQYEAGDSASSRNEDNADNGDDDDNGRNKKSNNQSSAYQNPYDYSYGGGTVLMGTRSDSKVVFQDSYAPRQSVYHQLLCEEGENRGMIGGAVTVNAGRPGSFDMMFEAYDGDVVVANDVGDDDDDDDHEYSRGGMKPPPVAAATQQQQRRNDHEDDNDECRPLHGQYMLRVRSKEIYSGDSDGFDDCSTSIAAAAAAAAASPAELSNEAVRHGVYSEADYAAARAHHGAAGGVYMKSFCHGGYIGARGGHKDSRGNFAAPVSFVNDGIRIIRLDTPGTTHSESVSVVNTADLNDEDFEALCEDWLNEHYLAHERPQSYLEEEDFAVAKAKDAHDRELFDLYCEFEASLRTGMSLAGALAKFTTVNDRVQHRYRVAIGAEKATADDDEERKKAAGKAAKPDVVDASSRKTYFEGSTAARYGAVGKNVSEVSRTFRVSISLPRTCTVTRVEVIRNTHLERKFDRYCEQLQKNGTAFNIGTGYHGTTESAVLGICETGFYMPLEHKSLEHKSGNAGFYGNGSYVSPDPNIAFWYSQGAMMLVTKVARGRVYKCPGMMMGAPLQGNYDSHESPDGTEWVLYNSSQVIPIAIIHFSRETPGARSTTTTVVTKATIRGRAAEYVRSTLDAKAKGGTAEHVSNKSRRTLNRIAGGAQGQRGKKK